MKKSVRKSLNKVLICIFVFFSLQILLDFRTHRSVEGLSVEILSTSPYNIGFCQDVVETGPAFDVSIADVNRRFKGQLNMTIRHFSNASLRSCQDIMSVSGVMIAEYFYLQAKTSQETCYIVTTSCDGGQLSIAKGLDWLAFHPSLRSPIETPDPDSLLIKLGGTYDSFLVALFDILHYHSWFHVSVLLDKASTNPFYMDGARLTLLRAKQFSLAFSIVGYFVDFSNAQSVEIVVKMAKEKSRIFIIFASGPLVAGFLKMTDRVGIAGGEFVFINLQAVQMESQGLASHFSLSLNDTNKKYIKSFRSLYYITYRPAGYQAEDINNEIEERAYNAYNVSKERLTEIRAIDSFCVKAAYEAPQIFATVINESMTDGSLNACSGRLLSQKIANRMWSLPTGRVFVDSNRTKYLNLNIFGFNMSTMTLQIMGKYEWTHQPRLVWFGSPSMHWPTPDHRPPLDKPPCGFTGTEGLCHINATELRTAWVALPLLVLFSIGPILLIKYSGKFKDWQDQRSWWIIEGDLIIYV